MLFSKRYHCWLYALVTGVAHLKELLTQVLSHFPNNVSGGGRESMVPYLEGRFWRMQPVGAMGLLSPAQEQEQRRAMLEPMWKSCTGGRKAPEDLLDKLLAVPNRYDWVDCFKECLQSVHHDMIAYGFEESVVSSLSVSNGTPGVAGSLNSLLGLNQGSLDRFSTAVAAVKSGPRIVDAGPVVPGRALMSRSKSTGDLLVLGIRHRPVVVPLSLTPVRLAAAVQPALSPTDLMLLQVPPVPTNRGYWHWCLCWRPH
jgi:hypothetical protein